MVRRSVRVPAGAVALVITFGLELRLVASGRRYGHGLSRCPGGPVTSLVVALVGVRPGLGGEVVQVLAHATHLHGRRPAAPAPRSLPLTPSSGVTSPAHHVYSVECGPKPHAVASRTARRR